LQGGREAGGVGWGLVVVFGGGGASGCSQFGGGGGGGETGAREREQMSCYQL